MQPCGPRRCDHRKVHRAIRVLGETLVVGNHANRSAALMEFAKQMHHSFAIVRIEVTGRLVRKQDRRSARKRAGNRDALLLTTGELTRQMFCPMGHAHALQRFRHKCFPVAGTGAAIRER